MASGVSQQSRLRTRIATLLLAAIALTTLFSLLTSRYGWKIYLELFSHFQLQYLIASLVLLGGLLLTRHRLMSALGLFFCVTLLAVQILPWYLPPAALLPKPESSLRVLIANINTQNRKFDQLLAAVRDAQPDLALFMEVSDIWVEPLDTLQDILPFSSGKDNTYRYGIVTYSRLMLENTQIVRFSPESTASITANISLNGQLLSLVAAHPMAPTKVRFFRARNQQLNAMASELHAVSQPLLVLGDFNITMWSPYYTQFISRTGLQNARQGFGILPSWPARGTYSPIPDWVSSLFSLPIDHCLLNSKLQVVNVRIGPDIGSDHYPVIVDIAANI